MPRRPGAAGLALLLMGCGAPDRSAELPGPAALDSIPLASDARLDSAGFLAGSFVGEGTARAVHLLSSDSVLLGELARREPRVHLAMVGSPLGHTEVTVAAIRLHWSRCGAAGQAEIVVEDHPAQGDPPLRGPVLGTFLPADRPDGRGSGLVRRPEPPAPSPALVDALIARTARDLDSTLGARHAGLELRPLGTGRVEVNTLADFDAADVIPIRVRPGAPGDDEIRYAVSLRQRRLGPTGDTLVAAGVMVWDSAGARRRPVFEPTLLVSKDGGLQPYRPGGRPLYWRRLQPLSDVAYARDAIWMEQVNVRNGRVVWGVIQPEENVVVAGAEVCG